MNLRLSQTELANIDAFMIKIQKTTWRNIGRIDAIVRAIDYANGNMFALDPEK